MSIRNMQKISGANGIQIKPVEDVAGSLKRYAKNYVTIEEAREGAARAAVADDDPRDRYES